MEDMLGIGLKIFSSGRIDGERVFEKDESKRLP